MKRIISVWRLKKLIDEYAAKLASEEVVNSEELASCHTVKLVIERGEEERLRSIQTLAEIGHAGGVGPAVNDLVRLSKQWPEKSKAKLPLLLLMTLRSYKVKNLR